MKKKVYPCILFLGILILIPGNDLAAQKGNRIIAAGVHGGPLFFYGDIGSMGVGYHAGISGSYLLLNNFRIRLVLDYGTFSDSDEGTQNSARDYAFSTSVFEPEISVVYVFFTQRGKGFTRKGMVKQWNKWTGLIFAGISFPYYNVTPARHLTPALMERNHGIAPAFSPGAALQYGLNEHTFIRLSVNPHFIFSDYLDGYTSENSSSYDVYHKVTAGFFYYFSL